MTRATFYELVLKELNDIELEYDDLKVKLRRGRGVIVIAQQMAELEIRRNEVDRLFQKWKAWF